MKVIECNQPTFFDIDRTLLSWHPVSEETTGSIRVTVDGISRWFLPHKTHLKQLHSHLARGHTVIIWSAGGVKWAESAAKALLLENTDIVVMEKPMWIYDDKQPVDFMPKADFLEDKHFEEHTK